MRVSPAPPLAPGTAGRVAAVIPARDEAEGIARAVASLLNQDYPGALDIFVVDDDSSDGTALIAQRAAGSRLTVIEGAPLPEGWTGKLWAVAQGVKAAEAASADYYLLTDADIVHERGNVSGLVARAEAGGFDLTSYMVKLPCRTTAERALMPAFVFFFFLLYPPEWIARRDRRTAGAAGGCMLIRPEALRRAGGIASIRGELIDDCALARRVKESGGAVWLGLTNDARSIRQSGSFGEIGNMISRTAFTELRHSPSRLAIAAAGLIVIYVAPPVLSIAGPDSRARLLGGVAWGLMSVAYWPVLRFYGRAPGWGPALPAIAAFYLGATIHSAFRYWTGRGGTWKGRIQDRRTA